MSQEKNNVDLITDVAQERAIIPSGEEAIDIREEALGTNLPANYYWSWQFLGTVVACCLSYNSSNLGYVLSSNSMARINADIGPSDNLVWIGLVMTLTMGVTFLLVGRLSDVFGRRMFFVVGNSFTVVGCILGAVAVNIEMIVGGNVFNGIGAAVQLSFGMIIEELVPVKHRPIWVSCIFMSGLPFLAFGPVIAQGLGDNTAASWRWCFYLGIIVAAVTSILLYLCYHPPDFHLLHSKRSRMEQVKRMDFIGMFFFTAGLVLFLIGLGWGGNKYPWNSSHVIVTIVVGVVCLIIFVFDSHTDSAIRFKVPQGRSFRSHALIACASVGSCVYYSMVILWPQQIAFLFPGSPLRNAFLACVIGSAVEVGQFAAGFLLKYLQWHRYILMFVCCLLTASAGGMAAVGPGDKDLGVALMFLAVFSVGVIECVAVVNCPITCPPEHLGSALGALGSIRSTCAAIATAIYSAILANKLGSITPARVSEAALDAGLPESSLPELLEQYSSDLSDVPGITAQITSAVEDAIVQAASASFKYVWYAVIAFGAVAIFSSWFTIDYTKYYTDEVTRKLQGVGGKKNDPVKGIQDDAV
ncbi:hypothetical protein PV10_05631 [Exophiala mesophila]|uniref:Major facilitator superfamily (MFS) profile domain-containing protein n=1 Tax=Exophiala mesophila TaxID=212818 RepID=A0A0D1XSG2_EXOME|nr:uncharacterized protein PV10_05631 [Exophiala mesophila]KIV91046.1 hypothetical protein PV10_05631 [Exophiala mesophila]